MGGGVARPKKQRMYEKNRISVQIPKIWLRGDGGGGVHRQKKQDQNPSFEKTQTPYGSGTNSPIEVTIVVLPKCLSAIHSPVQLHLEEWVRRSVF